MTLRLTEDKHVRLNVLYIHIYHINEVFERKEENNENLAKRTLLRLIVKLMNQYICMTLSYVSTVNS